MIRKAAESLRKRFIAWILVAGLATSVPLFSQSVRPNIIIILVDDLGFSTIDCYGGLVETPNIDSLAEKGVRFNQFCNTARSCPSRAMLLTGLYPQEAGMGFMAAKRTKKDERLKVNAKVRPYAYQGYLGENIPTLPEMMKSAGYSTYMSGKWHVGSSDTATWPLQRGFDRFYGFLGGTQDYYHPDDLRSGNINIEPSGERYYTTDAFTTEAIQFLADHDMEKDSTPFFLYLAFNAPHFPMQAMPEDYERYRGRFMAGWDILRDSVLTRQKEMGIVPENTVLAPRPGPSERLGSKGEAVPSWESLTPEQKDAMDAIMATYAALVDRVDQNVGRLIEALRKTGELDNTIIFFLSDNGGEAESPALGNFNIEDLGIYGKGGKNYGRAWATFTNTPFREYKHFMHQGGIQTPLIIHWPSGINSSMNNSIITEYGFLPDITMTCVDLAGATRPDIKNGKEVPDSDGRSLKGLLQGQDTPIHTSPVFGEHEGNRMIRLGRWKMVGFYNDPWELYDVVEDRSESHNVAGKHPALVRRLNKAYTRWAADAGVLPWDQVEAFLK